MGVRLASLIADLRSVMRFPLRQLQEVLRELHGMPVRLGERVELVPRMREDAEPVLKGLKAQVRASPAVQADQTGWREDGVNGSIASVWTPSIRDDEDPHWRAGEGVKPLIGENFQGVLGSDLSAGYHLHQGLHQRCWVHFLREVQELKDDFPHDEPRRRWAKDVKAIDEQAVAWAAQEWDPDLSAHQGDRVRVAQPHAFEQRLWKLCQPYAHTPAAHHTFCERVEPLFPERLVFVAVPGVPAHTNLAVRSVRPLVMARTSSGGTRRPKGRHPRMGLASLLGTWTAQHLNPFQQCLALLTSPSSLGQL
jgi:transposase